MTRGEFRVDIDLNPSGDDLVDQIKRQAADLIDLIETIPDAEDTGEVRRLKSLAQTGFEEASMWGVKAATKKVPD